MDQEHVSYNNFGKIKMMEYMFFLHEKILWLNIVKITLINYTYELYMIIFTQKRKKLYDLDKLITTFIYNTCELCMIIILKY